MEQAETDKIINNSIFNMDREIPKEVRNKERNKKIIRYGGIGVASIIVISVLISFMRTGVKTKDLVFSTVDKGTIEVLSLIQILPSNEATLYKLVS